MKNFKCIIVSEYTSQLTILRHFPKNFSMIHMPPKAGAKPIASAGCDTTLFLCKKLIFNSKYTPKLEYLVPFLKNFPEEIYICPLNP